MLLCFLFCVTLVECLVLGELILRCWARFAATFRASLWFFSCTVFHLLVSLPILVLHFVSLGLIVCVFPLSGMRRAGG